MTFGTDAGVYLAQPIYHRMGNRLIFRISINEILDR
jgi:hypothetical protein